MQNMLKQFTSFVADKFPLIIYALVILLVGLMLVKIIMRIVTAALNKSGINPSVRLFLKSLVKVMLYFVLIIIVAGNLGINTNSLIAVLGAAGLAVSLALRTACQSRGGILLWSRIRLMWGIRGDIGQRRHGLEIGLIYPATHWTTAGSISRTAGYWRRISELFRRRQAQARYCLKSHATRTSTRQRRFMTCSKTALARIKSPRPL